jgi:predicted O-linked N-acetylglucosamine transferase (SPINDLY family)
LYDDATLAQRIRDDEIDILIDLAGHTADNRLPTFAYKPAPVQVTWLGYPGTTGLTAMDYILVDKVIAPEHEPTPWSSETPYRLPHNALCYSPFVGSENLAVGALPAESNGYITFAVFNNYRKVSASAIRLWATILQRLPTAKLLIKGKPLSDARQLAKLYQQFADYGIAAERLQTTACQINPIEHLHDYQRVDLQLDTLPCSGGTTTCDSLWMGVPVITLYGDRYAARFSASFLTELALTDFIAYNEQEYIELAVQWAQRITQLAILRQTLRARFQASTLYNAQQFTASVEQAYRMMWQQWCQQ